jgi:cytochrome P450
VIELMSAERLDGGHTMMIFTDPPEHSRLRRLVSRAFTPRRVNELEDDIRSLCVSLLDPLVGRDRFDYVQEFGALLPAHVIATLLGVPVSDREMVRYLIDGMFHLDEDKGMVNDVAINAGGELAAYISDLLNDRRKNGRDDMLTDLVEVEIQEDEVTRHLTHDESLNFGLLLVAAGTETVARLIGWTGLVLADNPDQRAELAADPSLIPNAVEELLRYEAPSPVNARWTTQDVTLHDATIPAESKVVLLTGSAGRDERMYPDPDHFDIHRRIERHVSFGYGIHLCIGAALARMEGRIALEETLKRWSTWEVDRDAAVLLFTSTVRGYSELPIAV